MLTARGLRRLFADHCTISVRGIDATVIFRQGGGIASVLFTALSFGYHVRAWSPFPEPSMLAVLEWVRGSLIWPRDPFVRGPEWVGCFKGWGFDVLCA